jgi:predicted PurR-regulated permease PerM
MNDPVQQPPLPFARSSAVIVAALLVFALAFHLLPGLLAGLLIYEVVHAVAPRIRLGSDGSQRRAIVAGLVSTLVGVILVALVSGVAAFLRSDASGYSELLQKGAEIIESTRGMLPAWILQLLPEDVDSLRSAIAAWLREHAATIGQWGREFGITAAHVLIGMVIGLIVSLQPAGVTAGYGPLGRALVVRLARFGAAFRHIVFAQVRIAAFNTLATALFLSLVLPAFGVHLPYIKTIVIITFVAGLLPIVGNLISNTVIVVVSLSVSPSVALSALVFLVVLHKLEYFLNAHFVGQRIHASAWELLVAMVVLEAAFGLQGLVAAPIYYAYLKDELVSAGLV